MKTFKAKRGPFAQQPHFSVDEIDLLCAEELHKVGLLPAGPAPVRIDRFIEKRFKPHTYAELPDGVLGLTLFGPNGVEEIVLSEALERDSSKPAERRVRTTLAHEAGHALLHAHLFALEQAGRPLFGDWSDPRKPKVLCREPGGERAYSGEWWEYQANMVMGAILLPKALVTMAVRGLLRPIGTMGLVELTDAGRTVAISLLSDIFDVNPVVARIRLQGVFPGQAGGQLSL